MGSAGNQWLRDSVIAQMKAAVHTRLIAPLETARTLPYVRANDGWVPIRLQSRANVLAVAMDPDEKTVQDGHLRFYVGGLSKKGQQESGQCGSPIQSIWRTTDPGERWECFLQKIEGNEQQLQRAVRVLQRSFQEHKSLWWQVARQEKMAPGTGRSVLPSGYRVPVLWQSQTVDRVRKCARVHVQDPVTVSRAARPALSQRADFARSS